MAVKFVTTSEVALEGGKRGGSVGRRGHIHVGRVLAPLLRRRDCLHKSAIPWGQDGGKGVVKGFAGISSPLLLLTRHAPHDVLRWKEGAAIVGAELRLTSRKFPGKLANMSGWAGEKKRVGGFPPSFFAPAPSIPPKIIPASVGSVDGAEGKGGDP